MKLLLLICAFALAIFLAIFVRSEGSSLSNIHQQYVFLLPWDQNLSVAKNYIQKNISSDVSYGLILFASWSDYFIPPTTDSGTFLTYLSGVSANLFSSWETNFQNLNTLLAQTYQPGTTYLLVSQFPILNSKLQIPKWSKLLMLNPMTDKKFNPDQKQVLPVSSTQSLLLYALLGLLIILWIGL